MAEIKKPTTFIPTTGHALIERRAALFAGGRNSPRRPDFCPIGKAS